MLGDLSQALSDTLALKVSLLGKDGQVQCEELELWNLNPKPASYQVAM